MNRKRISAVGAVLALGVAALGAGRRCHRQARPASPQPGRCRRRRAAQCSTRARAQPQFLIATDLPLQGAGRAQNIAMGKAIQYVLDTQYHFKAGKYTVGYQECDDSTAQTGAWDPGEVHRERQRLRSRQERRGRARHVQLRVREADPPVAQPGAGRAVAMFSVANTAVGLTHFAPWNDKGEPGIYYPTGKRNYARLSACDDYQGPAAASTCSSSSHNQDGVRDPRQPDLRQGRRQRVQAEGRRARDQGARLQAVGSEGDELRGPRPARSRHSGAQSVYLGGIVCNNGVKLLKDIRAAVGRSRSSSARTAGRRTPPPLRRGLGGAGHVRQLRGPAAGEAGREGQGVHRGVQQVPAPAQRASCRRRTRSTRRRRRRSSWTRSRSRTGRGRTSRRKLFKIARHERDHGHLPLRQERRHHPDQGDQLRPASKGKTGVPACAVILKVGMS